MKRSVAAAGLCLLLLAGGCQRHEKAKAVPQPPTAAGQGQTQGQEPAEEQEQEPAPTGEPAAPRPRELAAVSTPLRDKRPGRLKNLHLACGSVNGAVIPPGGSFSFNQTVGERTAEKGYEEAIVYKDRQKVPEVGGGVCQLSSTLYLAAQQAGFDVTERHAHQLPSQLCGRGAGCGGGLRQPGFGVRQHHRPAGHRGGLAHRRSGHRLADGRLSPPA